MSKRNIYNDDSFALQYIGGDLIPNTNNAYTIGNNSFQFNTDYLADNLNITSTSNQLVLGNKATINCLPGTAASTTNIPAVDDTVVCRNTPDTLTNKTLTTPTINSATLSTPVFSGISTGIIQNSSQYCFKAYNNVGQTGVTGAGEQYTVIFDTIDFQVGTGYNSSTGVFTAPINGLYHFTTNIQTGGWTTSNTNTACWFYHNTTKYNMHMTNNISFSTGYLVSNFSSTFNMKSGDYITVGIEVDGNSTANISIISGSMNTNLIGTLLVATG